MAPASTSKNTTFADHSGLNGATSSLRLRQRSNSWNRRSPNWNSEGESQMPEEPRHGESLDHYHERLRTRDRLPIGYDRTPVNQARAAGDKFAERASARIAEAEATERGDIDEIGKAPRTEMDDLRDEN